MALETEPNMLKKKLILVPNPHVKFLQKTLDEWERSWWMFVFQGTSYLFVLICFNHKQLPIPFCWIMLPCSIKMMVWEGSTTSTPYSSHFGGCHSELSFYGLLIFVVERCWKQVSMWNSKFRKKSEFYRTWLLRYATIETLDNTQYFVKHHLQCKKHFHLLVWVVVAFQFVVSLLLLPLLQAGFLPVTIGVQPPLLGLEPQLPMI